MMHILVSVYLLVSWLILVHSRDEYTAIARKEYLKHPKLMVLDASSYGDLVKNSNMFVDKSTFLKYLFTFYERSILITYPEKWGKSINLDMIKAFFEIEVDSQGIPLHPSKAFNRRLFYHNEILLENDQVERLKKPLLICQYKSFVQDYQGKYPVIYLKMGNITGTSYDHIIDLMCARIKETFQRHSYMRKILRNVLNTKDVDDERKLDVEKKLEKFDSFLNGNTDTDSLTDSLVFLSAILKSHFARKVLILIDDYDGIFRALYNALFTERHQRDIMSFYSSFVTKTLVNNAHLEKAILIGTFQILDLFPALNETKHYNISDIRIYRYFGFTKLEVDVMLRLHSLGSDIRERCFLWYGGYQCGVKRTMKLYNSRSFANFICNQKSDTYHGQSITDEPFLRVALQHKRFRGILISLVNGKTYNPRFLHASHEKLYRYRNDFYNLTAKGKVLHRPFRLFLTYIHAIGLVAVKRNASNTQCSTQIPNNDIRAEIANKVMNFYIHQYAIPLTTIDSIVDLLATFIDSNETTSEPLIQALQSLFDIFPIYNDTHDLELMTFLLHYLAIRVTISRDYWIDNPLSSTSKPDVIFYTNHLQVIIKAKLFANSVENIMDQVKKYEVVSPFKYITSTRLIAIGISADKRVNILADLQEPWSPTFSTGNEEYDVGIEPNYTFIQSSSFPTIDLLFTDQSGS